ncbi:MAG: serine hydrolase [Bacteroidota bacterium]
MLKKIGLLFALFFLVFLTVQAQSGLLEKEIELDKTSGSIAQLLEEISEKGGFTFTYSNQIPVSESVNLKRNTGTVRMFLDRLFPKRNIRYAPLNNRIALSLIKKSSAKPKLVISGTVYDKETKAPLPFTHVSLLNNKRGTASNVNGEFRLLLPEAYKEDSLRFSFVGYHPLRKKIIELPENAKIYLTEDKRVLDEVVFKGLTTLQILEQAVSNIPKNHRPKAHITQGFYRMTAKRENAVAQLSEAVFDIYTNKYGEDKPQFRLEKMRLLQDEKVTEGLDFGLTPRAVVNVDIINVIDDLNLFSKKGLKIHDFIFEETTIYKGRSTYVISFDRKDEEKKRVGRKGKVYIDTETFAFVYIDYGFSPKGVHHVKYGSKAFRALMAIFDIHVDKIRDDVKISYKKIGDNYYLNTVESDEQLTLRSDGRHYDFKLDFHIDYVATNTIVDEVKPFDNEEIIGQQKLIETQESQFDPDFWSEYTILTPELDFNEVAKTVEANNEAEKLKEEIEDALRKFPKDDAARIDSILTFYNRKNLFNGNALIAFKGQPIFQKSYNNSLVQNDSSTQFRIGSTAKTFTSTLILMLEHEGKLDLKDTIGTYIPDYPHGQVTIEQLLSHQSGIPNYLQNTDHILRVFEEEPTTKEWVETFGKDTLDFDPGTDFKYSNTGFLLLAHIAEVVTGEDFAFLLKAKIFDPLGMKDTYSGTPGAGRIVPRGYYYGQLEKLYALENTKGAAGVVSTIADLLKWSQALESDVLLPKELLDKAYMPRAAYTDWDGDYGYGWMLDNYMFKTSKKHEIRYHPGTDYGFYSMFLKQPDEGITIILLSNTGDFPRFEVTDLILEELN